MALRECDREARCSGGTTLDPRTAFVGEWGGCIEVDQMPCDGDGAQDRVRDRVREASRVVEGDPGVLLAPHDVERQIDIGKSIFDFFGDAFVGLCADRVSHRPSGVRPPDRRSWRPSLRAIRKGSSCSEVCRSLERQRAASPSAIGFSFLAGAAP